MPSGDALPSAAVIRARFTAIPMPGACIALFLMRDNDTLFTVGRR